MPAPTILSIDRLLGAGYLPEVLPPCFSSETFGGAFTPLNTPHTFFDNCELPTKKNPQIPVSSKCVKYSHARVGGARRLFSIPNPVHFYRLAKCFLDNWSDIQARAHSSAISLTKPVLAGGPRCLKHEVSIRDRPAHRARVRAAARYILRTDISRFFPSIYTHSIPWAIHGKAFAKANRSHAHYGNALDAHFRNIQDGQTIGIPVGQDVSRAIAEVLLGYVESQMKLKKWPRGMRCIDDFEVGFLNESDASEFCHRLASALAEFELAINPLKTAILPLPQTLIDRWDAELRQFDLGGSSVGPDDADEGHDAPETGKSEPAPLPPTKEKLLLFFNKAIDLQLKYPDEAVLRFSVRRLAHLRMTQECWPLYESYLLHCALNQPETLRLVVSNLLKARYLDKMRINMAELRTVLNAVIIKAAPIGHSSDVAWSLWAALVFDVKLSKKAGDALQELPDSIVGCLACEAKKRGVLPKKFMLSWLSGVVSAPNAFYEEHWLLAYEANRNGWVTPAPVLDPCFAYLCTEGVRFFIEDQVDKIRADLKGFHKKPAPTTDDDDDESDSEDAFDNWWFHDEGES